MPRVPATRRASSASARVQQPLPCTWRWAGVSASFRWTPVTSHPASTASAAVTDESTPPLIATSTWVIGAPGYSPPSNRRAPGSSGSPGHGRRRSSGALRGQDLEGPADGGDGLVDVDLGRAVAEAEADRLPRLGRVPPHGHQHVRRGDGPTGTCRPGRARDPVAVQQQQQVLGPPPREPHRQQPRQPGPRRGGVAVELEVGCEGLEARQEAGAEGGQGGGGVGLAVGEGGVGGGAEAGDGGGREGARAEAALLSAAVEQGPQGGAGTDDQGADPGGAAELVGGQGEQ